MPEDPRNPCEICLGHNVTDQNGLGRRLEWGWYRPTPPLKRSTGLMK